MAMKKEALTNLIADDLAKRNDNWDEIDNTFALKADKATTYTKTEVDTSLGLKADKQQEEWITPTLLNGWSSSATTSTSVKYYKNTLGEVKLIGRPSNGISNSIVFNLPLGYRPSEDVRFVCATRGQTSFWITDIRVNGNVYIIKNDETTDRYVDLSSITFKAV